MIARIQISRVAGCDGFHCGRIGEWRNNEFDSAPVARRKYARNWRLNQEIRPMTVSHLRPRFHTFHAAPLGDIPHA